MYISASTAAEANISKILAESIRRFCRSIELCDGYLRGYYGLKMVRLAEPMVIYCNRSNTTPLGFRPNSTSSFKEFQGFGSKS